MGPFASRESLPGLVMGRPPKNNLLKRRFGWLTVVEFAGRRKRDTAQWVAYWWCECKCGTRVFLAQSSLLSRAL